MEAMKILIIITITMALSITLTMKSVNEKGDEDEEPITPPRPPVSSFGPPATTEVLQPSRSLSRFLAEGDNKNPRSSSATSNNCRKNKKICKKIHGKKWKCCNNKCKDLENDKNNCGGCKKKCKYTEECCKGKCVDVAYDKRHCGQCNRPCHRGKFCVYGMCEYA